MNVNQNIGIKDEVGNKHVITVRLPVSFWRGWGGGGRCGKGERFEDNRIKEGVSWFVYFRMAKVSIFVNNKKNIWRRIH